MFYLVHYILILSQNTQKVGKHMDNLKELTKLAKQYACTIKASKCEEILISLPTTDATYGLLIMPKANSQGYIALVNEYKGGSIQGQTFVHGEDVGQIVQGVFANHEKIQQHKKYIQGWNI